MFRKSVFIMLFVCLLASCQIAWAYPTDNQLEWQAGGHDANWYNPANWNQEGTLPCPPTGPGPDFYCAVLPNQPGPRISGNPTCSMLSLNPWDPSPWGGQDVNIIVSADALDVNFGAAIQIASQSDYDSYLGGPTLVSKAIVNVYGGTVTTPNPAGSGNMTGITVGGGGSNFGMSYGQLNIYGGLVNVPRLVLNFGEVGIYGGTLQINTDVNFSVNTAHPGAAITKIKVDGGTLIVAGNHIPDINTYRTGGFIVCQRGTLRDPVFDSGTNLTTILADVNLCVWNPTPANNALNVHFKAGDTNSITLHWSPSTLNDLDVNNDIYFGTSFDDVNRATTASTGIYMGSRNDDSTDPCNTDPCSFIIKDPNKFALDTYYFWRVDEYSVTDGFKKGLVWAFKTHNGKAYTPKPIDDANASKVLSQPLQLSWLAGDWAGYHRVFFGTQFSAVQHANTGHTDGRYRGTVSSPVYPLSRLKEKGPGASYVLNVGQTYYWRIDEVNNTTVWAGDTWAFTPGAYINIDDFEDSMSTDDVNANWLYGYTITPNGSSGNCNNPTALGKAGRLLVRDSTGKYLRYTYNNDGTHPEFSGVSFSEAKRAYPNGTSFTGNSIFSPAMRALRLDYKGLATNAAHGFLDSQQCEGDHDRMYVEIEDTAGHVAVYLNPDANAQLGNTWTSWYTVLTDINDISHGKDSSGNPATVDLNSITGFSIGFGLRGNTLDTDGVDVNSIVLFDNIRLYASTCVPQFGPTADLDGDCDVDLNDLDLFANDWLKHADNYVFSPYTQPAKAPILWYKFDNANGADTNQYPADYGTGDANNYVGTINAFVAQDWKHGGGRNGSTCLYLPSGRNSYVSCPTSALNFMSDPAHATDGGGITFATWINADLTAPDFSSWLYGFIVVKDVNNNDAMEIACPHHYSISDWSYWGAWAGWTKNGNPSFSFGPGTVGANYGGRWNHWAFVKAPHTLSWYCNGSLIKQEADTDANTNDAYIYGPLFPLPVSAFTIGLGGWGGNWAGYINDFQVYDYALSAEEVAYLATDGTGHVILPLVSPANFNKDGSVDIQHDANQIVNFGDMAIMGQQWHTQILWP